jgi:hypothetical protein
VSNDLLWLVAQSGDRELRARLLTKALAEYENRDWTAQDTGAGRAIILDVQAGLLHDRWALFADYGDPMLAPEAYWRSRRWLLLDALADRHPFIRSDTVGRAVADIAARHGLAAATAFMKQAWTHQQVLSIDDFFFHFHSLLRAEAWGLTRVDALRELTTGPPSDADNIVDRARALAELDADEGREAASLATLVAREFAEAEERLRGARKLRYADFLRAANAIRPVLYSLRDLDWELHFLTAEGDSGQFIERERITDEWQADMFQLHLTPMGPMVERGLVNDMSESAMRRHLAFWTRARVQLNEEMEQIALSAFREGGTTAMIGRLDSARRAALDPTLLAAVSEVLGGGAVG